MPSSGLDVLAYSRDLETAGLTRMLAEAIAKGMTGMVVEQFYSLVSQEHFAVQIELIALQLSQVDQRFDRMDERLDGIDKRMGGFERRLYGVVEEVKGILGRLESLESKVNLHTWMLGLIVVMLVIPQLQRWFSAV